MTDALDTRCKETAGFLFSHPCKNPASHRCERCQKPVCVAHLRLSDGQQVCVECQRSAGPAAAREGEEVDPYSYAGHYYDDYYRYSVYDRYSRSDRAAFEESAGGQDWEGEEGWESDFDAS